MRRDLVGVLIHFEVGMRGGLSFRCSVMWRMGGKGAAIKIRSKPRHKCGHAARASSLLLLDRVE